MRVSYSGLEPSHQTTRAGWVSPATSSTHLSATPLTLMGWTSGVKGITPVEIIFVGRPAGVNSA